MLKTKYIFKQFVVAAGALVLIFFSVEVLSAWSPPSDAPPTGNVTAPLNVGAANQSKTGALGLGGAGTFDSGVNLDVSGVTYTDGLTVFGNTTVTGSVTASSVTANPLCIGGACRSSWPSSGYTDLNLRLNRGGSSCGVTSNGNLCLSGYTQLGSVCFTDNGAPTNEYVSIKLCGK